MKLSKEVKTALLIILGIVLFIFGFNYLKGKNLLDSSKTMYTIYDNVEGLEASTPVTINGLTVGRVQNISFTEDGTGRLKIEFVVNSDFSFSKNSKAELYEAGLIGGKAIAIKPAFDKAEEAKSGTMLQGTVKAKLSELVNQRLTPLQEKIETMMVSADSLLSNLNQVFDEERKASLRNSISALEQTILSFKSTSNNLNKLIEGNQEKLSQTLTNAENATNNLSKITDSVANADLGTTLKNLQTTVNSLNSVLASVENGEGSIGKLLKDEGLYDNLEGASKQLEELLQDFKLNPKRYVHFSVFGKKAKRYDAEGNEIKDKD